MAGLSLDQVTSPVMVRVFWELCERCVTADVEGENENYLQASSAVDAAARLGGSVSYY